MSQIVNFNPNDKSTELQQRMMSVFKFNAEDLRCNREGKLSDSQRGKITRTARMSLIGFLFIGVLFNFMFFLSWNKPLNKMPLIYPAFFTIIFTAIGIYLYWISKRAFQQGIVKSATGTLGIKFSGKFILVCIGNECFRTGVSVNKVLERDILYKVYYTPADRSIMSIERVV